ncbi:MAG: GGDEF domain-containing protein [Planctomycetes bacterium]|nr:GGDEF domain-containing protein [Planctomycetota bacterium]
MKLPPAFARSAPRAAGAASSPPAADPPTSRWYIRLAFALTTFLGGTALTLLVVLLLRKAEANRFTEIFHRRAAQAVGELQRDFERDVELAFTIAALWDLSESFRTPIFERFVAGDLTFESDLEVLGWIERVPSLGREAFEARLAADGSPLRLIEPGADGVAMRATRRAEHFPVVVAAGRDGAAIPPVGLDFAAFPDRLAAMERARRTGTIQAIGHLPQLLLVPHYAGETPPDDEAARDQRLEGFVVVAVSITDCLRRAARAVRDDAEIHLFALDEGREQPIALEPASGALASATLLEQRHAWREEWVTAGQHWRTVMVPTAAAEARDGARWSWLVLATGLSLSLAGGLAVARVTRERRRLEREVRQFWELSNELLCLLDAAGVVRRANPAWEAQLGEAIAPLGRPLLDLLHEEDRPAASDALHKARGGAAAAGFDARLREQGGRWRWFQWSLAPDEARRSFHAAARDVTAQRQTFEELERRATLDPLTHVLTRRALFERLGKEIHRAKRYGTPLALAVLDLDHFKEVNDRHGHATGDELLKRLGLLLRKALRDSDLAGRFGGDEFVVVMPQTEFDAARKAAARILRSFHDKGAITAADGTVIPLRCSIGVASLGPAIEDATALVEQADAQLYEAKVRGRGRIE